MPENVQPRPFRILVIDDDEVVCQLLDMMLAMEGHAVTTSLTGHAGIALLQQAGAAYDVVLCDQQLPDIGTEELAASLAAVRPEGTLLIAMSATAPEEGAVSHFDTFLLKPFQPEALGPAVERARAARSHGSTAALDAPVHNSEGGAGCELDEKIFGTLRNTLPPAQLLELYSMTLNDVAERVERMRTALEAGDTGQYQREAHAIKGGCGMVGAVELRELATKAEGGSPESTPPLEDFLRAGERLQRILNRRLT